jgi:hypothetical protein
MDSNVGVQFSDLMGEYDLNINSPVAFSSIFVDNISENTIGNTVVLGNTITTQSIIPDANGSRDIGSTIKKFANGYINNLIISTTTMSSIILTSNPSWPGISISNFGLNKWTTDGNLYFDQGGGSTSGYVFRNNNGGTTLCSILNNLLTSTVPMSITDTTQSTSVTTGSIVCAGGLGVSKMISTTDLTTTNVITSPGVTSSTALTLTGNNGVVNLYGIPGTTSGVCTVQIGRVTPDLTIGISTANNQYLTGSVYGDTCFKTAFPTNSILFGNSFGTTSIELSPNQVIIPGTSSSISPTTGSLITGGGAGFSGNINASGSITAGTAINAGSASIAGNITLGGGNIINLLLPTTGGSATVLSYYEQFNFNSILAGALGTAAPTCIGNITRFGNVVTYNYQSTTGLASSTAQIVWATNLPSRFTPSVQRDLIAGTQNGAVFSTGILRILTTGQIQCFATMATGSFTSGGTVGFYGGCVTWTI